MNRSILNEISVLLKDGVISEEVADKIKNYYSSKETSSISRLYLVFGILGALSIGLGLILIIAHNWDDFSRSSKTIFSFFPLLIGQLLGGYTLLKRPDSNAWKETSSVLIFFGVGAGMALISQIYNIPGNFNAFILTWMLVTLPLVYILNSSVTSLFYLIGITYYVCNTQYWEYSSGESYLFWLYYILLLPHYYLLWRKQTGNFLTLHHFVFPLAVTVVLGTTASHYTEIMFINYISLFSLFFILGNHPTFSHQNFLKNGYLIIGGIGLIGVLMSLSFHWFWRDIAYKSFAFSEVISSPEIIATAIIALLIAMVLSHYKYKPFMDFNPLAFSFVVGYVLFMIGLFSTYIPQILTNIFILFCGLKFIRQGNAQDSLGLLNLGLLVIAILIVCRFFDLNISYVLRGILFVVVGSGFFLINFYMFKRRKSFDKTEDKKVLIN